MHGCILQHDCCEVPILHLYNNSLVAPDRWQRGWEGLIFLRDKSYDNQKYPLPKNRNFIRFGHHFLEFRVVDKIIFLEKEYFWAPEGPF